MSVRLHVHQRHEIEYGSKGFVNEKYGLLNLLKDIGCDIWSSDESQEGESEWEIDAEDFRKAVEQIKEIPAAELERYFDSHSFKKNQIVKELENYIETGTDGDGYYHFSWF